MAIANAIHKMQSSPFIEFMNATHPDSTALTLISTQTAEHYAWGDGCDAWFFLKNGSVHVIQERMPARTAEVMHYHRYSRQLFYVLRGELTMRSESNSVVIPAGHAVGIEP